MRDFFLPPRFPSLRGRRRVGCTRLIFPFTTLYLIVSPPSENKPVEVIYFGKLFAEKNKH